MNAVEKCKTVLVAGASGSTGRLLVRRLLDQGVSVKAIVRPQSTLPTDIVSHKNLTLITASLLDLSDEELSRHVLDCDAVASCLGHNMSLKGMYGHPRRLVTDATRRLCKAIVSNLPQEPVKFVLMNTAGNRNSELAEPISLAQRFVVGLVRLLLPPQSDNEQAAEYLRRDIGGKHGSIEWSVVRPDSLTDAATVTAYKIYPSPIRSAIFNPGKTSRINVADFMTRLMIEDDCWVNWRGQMPVIYNKES